MNKWEKAFENALGYSHPESALMTLAKTLLARPEMNRDDVYDFFVDQLDKHKECLVDRRVFFSLDYIAGLHDPEEYE